MPKSSRSNSSAASVGRDLRALLHVPQHDLQAQLATRLERLGFPSLRPALVQLLSVIGTGLVNTEAGVRLSDLVSAVSLPKQTVGDLLDELEDMRMVERFPDPDHGEIKRVSAATEAKWATRLGSKKMRSLRALLEELAATVEDRAAARTNGARSHKR